MGLRKFLIDAGAGLVLALLVSVSRGVFSVDSTADVMMALSDGFFVAAAMLLACGGLQWTYNGGVMDGLGYTFKLAVARIRRDFEENRPTFAAYQQAREKKASSPKWLLLAGALHLLIALCFLLVYSYV